MSDMGLPVIPSDFWSIGEAPTGRAQKAIRRGPESGGLQGQRRGLVWWAHPRFQFGAALRVDDEIRLDGQACRFERLKGKPSAGTVAADGSFQLQRRLEGSRELRRHRAAELG